MIDAENSIFSQNTIDGKRDNNSIAVNTAMRTQKSNLSDFKHLLESSQIIDEIFHQRSINLEA